MARFESDEEMRRLAAALARLRQAAGLSQAEAGQRAGMTSQGWSAYEAGRRAGLFRPDVQRRLTAALGADPETLALEAASGPDGVATSSASPGGVEGRGRNWSGAEPSDMHRLTLADDRLAPWAGRGVVLEYRLGVEPRAGQGLVAVLSDGEQVVGIVQNMRDTEIAIRPSTTVSEDRLLQRADIVRLGAVTARIDK